MSSNEEILSRQTWADFSTVEVDQNWVVRIPLKSKSLITLLIVDEWCFYCH